MSAMSVLALMKLAQWWRQGETLLRRRPGWWAYGDAAWRGWVRAAPTGFLGMLLLLVAAWSGIARGGDVRGKPVEATLLLLGFFGMLASVLVMLFIILFNQPKQLVPPHLRDQPGALTEWLTTRRSATRG